MADAKQLKQAKSVYESLCKMIDNNKIKYQKNEEDLSVNFSMGSSDLDIHMTLIVDPDAMIVTAYSPLPFTVTDDHIVVSALAASYLNYHLIKDGSFDFDVIEGNMVFRLTSSYRDSIISENLLEYVMHVSLSTVNAFNDSLYRVAKGKLSLEEFVKSPRDTTD